MKKTVEIAFYPLDCEYMGDLDLDTVISEALIWFNNGLTSGIELKEHQIYFKEEDKELIESIDQDRLDELFDNWYEETDETNEYEFDDFILTVPHGYFG